MEQGKDIRINANDSEETMKDIYIYNKVIRRTGRIWLLFLFALVSFPTEAQVTYQRTDSIKICQVLKQADQNTSTLALARQFMNIPYVGQTLEVNDR